MTGLLAGIASFAADARAELFQKAVMQYKGQRASAATANARLVALRILIRGRNAPILRMENQVTAVFATQVELDDRGIAWLAGTNVKVLEVALDKIAHGWSPDEIHFQHPHLSLAQIHAALTWYYENQEDIDGQIEAAAKDADRLSLEVSDPVFRRELIRQKQSF